MFKMILKVFSLFLNLWKKHRKVTNAIVIAGSVFSVGTAIAIPLDKLEYHTVLTPDGYHIVFPKKNKYGFPEVLSQTDLIGLEYCSSGAGCSPDALAKGALYYRIYTVNGQQVIAYYNADGKLVATQQSETDSPTHLATSQPPKKLATPNIGSFADSTKRPVGYLEADFAVSDSGSATYNVPIAIPSGTAGVKPDISLSYNSQSGEGVAGLGWSISGLSAISRCGKTIAQDGVVAGIKFDDTDNFCLEGQRLVRISGSQGGNKAKYRTEINNYSEITSYDTNGDKNPEYFEVRSKAGEVQIYGNTADSRVKRVFTEPSNLTASQKNITFSWALKRTQDLKNNYIEYVYNNVQSRTRGLEHTLKQIKYTGNLSTGLSPYAFINFVYENKHQPTTGYLEGSTVYRSKRLKTIQVKYGASLIREYKLAYNSVPSTSVTKQDRLKSIQECGSTACLPATKFTWDGSHASNNGDGAGSKSFSTWTKYSNLGWNNFHPDYTSRLVGDVNGDGISDVVAVRFKANTSRNVKVGLGTGVHTSRFDFTGFNSSKANIGFTRVGDAVYRYPSYLADVNGDSKSDLINFNLGGIAVHLSNGNGFDSGTTWLPERAGTQFVYGTGWRKDEHPVFIQDVNGDGKADIVGVKGEKAYVSLSNGKDGFASPKPWINNFGKKNFLRNANGGSETWNFRDKHLVQLVDVSGDGLPDLVGFNDNGVSVALNNGNGFVEGNKLWINNFGQLSGGTCYGWTQIDNEGGAGGTWSIPEFPLSPLPKCSTAAGSGGPLRTEPTPLYTCDRNPDQCHPKRFDSENGSNYFDSAYIKTKYIYGWHRDANPREFGDVNGDGLADIVGFGDDGVYVSYSTGKSFTKAKKLSNEFGFTYGKGASHGRTDLTGAFSYLFGALHLPANIKKKSWGWDWYNKNDIHPRQLLDINGDGKSDIVGFWNDETVVALSTGNGFSLSENWTRSFARNTGWLSPLNLRSFGDFNGDGVVDILGIDKQGISIGENKAEPLRITSIKTGGQLNRAIEIEYEKLTAKGSHSIYDRNSNNRKESGLQPALFVVSAHQSSNGDITNIDKYQAKMEYEYEGFDVDRNGRGSKGFSRRSVKDLLSNIRTYKYYHQHTDDKDFPLTGTTYSEVSQIELPGKATKILNSKLLDLRSRSRVGLNGKFYELYTKSNEETDHRYPQGTIYKKVVTTSSTPNECGNIISVTTETTDVLKNNQTFYKNTRNTYPTTGSCFKQSRLISARVVSKIDGTDSRVRASSFTYDSKGQIKTETVEPGHALSSTTSYSHDAYGNVTRKSITGANTLKSNGTVESNSTRSVNTAYDTKGRFATSVTNAKGHTEKRTYDNKLGLVTSVTGPNGLKSRTYYNQFAQKYLSVSPNNSTVHTSYSWCNLASDQPIYDNKARYCTTTSTSEGGYSKTYFDQLDRVLRTETRGLNGKKIFKDKRYSLKSGELIWESLPYFKGASRRWVVHDYDELERPKSIKQPGQEPSTITYDGLETRTVDTLGRVKTQRNNALGKPDWVRDHFGNEVHYTYYSDGNLKTTTNEVVTKWSQQASENPTSVTSFVYDKLGHKISMNDPDMGFWRYRYNAFGELVWQRSANHKTVTMSYDNLGRIKTRTENEGTTSWVYDNAEGKGIGKLRSVAAPLGYRKTLKYTDLGQLAEVEESLPNTIVGGGTVTYKTQNTYDAHGRVDTVKYPVSNPAQPVAVKHIYDTSSGALERIKHAYTGKQYWKATDTDAYGNITLQSFGNGVDTRRLRDYLGRLSKVRSGKNLGTGLQSIDYEYDDLGNLKVREDYRSDVREDFTYDSVNRLLTSKSTYQGKNIVTKQIRYDGHGNIVKKDKKAYEYNSGRTHAVTGIGSDNYTYDNNGNMKGGAGRTIKWTSFDKPSFIRKDSKTSKDSQTIQMAYGADRQRVLKQGSNTADKSVSKNTWYIGGLFERELITSGDEKGKETHKFYLNAGGQTVGYITQHKRATDNKWVAQNTRYLLTDHLGSIDIVTDSSGVKLQKLSFDSWGKRRNAAWQDIGGTELDRTIAALSQESVNRGFTGHEMDDEVGLINMKGRLYDAEIGRFISADPHVQAPTDTQSFNRYTYVKNNPLSYTDPSGYFFKSLFKKIRGFFKKWGRTIFAIGLGVLTGGLALKAYAFLGGFTSAVIGGAVGGFTSGLVSTGSLKGALTGAVFGALSAGLARGVGHGIPGISKAIGEAGSFTRHVAHGVAQGTVSVLRGGKFGAGFASGFAGSYTAKYTENLNDTGRVAASAIVGGTVSKLTGGKFVNGAMTAAFVMMFNHLGDRNAALAKIRSLVKYRFEVAHWPNGTSSASLINEYGSSMTLEEGLYQLRSAENAYFDSFPRLRVRGEIDTFNGKLYRYDDSAGWERYQPTAPGTVTAASGYRTVTTTVIDIWGLSNSGASVAGGILSYQQGDIVGAALGAAGTVSNTASVVGAGRSMEKNFGGN